MNIEIARSSERTADDEPIIAALAKQFSVSAQEVGTIYRSERRRLESGARIQSFLNVLAIGSTRTILRSPDLRGATLDNDSLYPMLAQQPRLDGLSQRHVAEQRQQ